MCRLRSPFPSGQKCKMINGQPFPYYLHHNIKLSINAADSFEDQFFWSDTGQYFKFRFFFFLEICHRELKFVLDLT